MAEEGDSGEKTEDPTARRRSQSRADGMVGRSVDLSNLLGLVAAYIGLQHISPMLWEDMQLVTRMSFTTQYFREPLTLVEAHNGFIGLLWIVLPEIILLMIISAFFGAGSTLLQTDFLWSWKLLKPRMKSIDPFAGISRIFSKNNAIQLAKSIAKLCIIGPIGYFAFIEFFPQLVGLMEAPLTDLIPFTAIATDHIFWQVVKFVTVVAILDLIWQKFKNKEDLKMSKHEVKDERKAVEGDEATKRRIRQLGMQRLRDQMFRSIPTADVVVTNPTHIAVALSYSGERGQAPRVVAKGKGYVAERIKRIAKQNGIPVLERKPLARALFKAVNIGQEIPYELYQTVAEILAYVYRIKGKQAFKSKPQTGQGASTK